MAPLPRRHPRRYAVAAATVAPMLALVGCSTGGEGPAPDPAADPGRASPTPLAALDTRDLVVPRADPCGGVPRAAVVEALGSPAVDAQRWADGERAPLAAGVHDVAHEWGCAFRAADGSAARAWVFAPPVTPERAREVARAVVADAGCRPIAGAAAFGRSTAARTCRVDEVLVAAWSGLFGDAWLSCSLSTPRGEADTPVAREALVARADAWCSQVVSAAQG